MPMVGDDGKPLMPYQAPSQTDNRPEAQKTIEFFQKNPKALETWAEINRAKEKSGDMTESGAFKAAIDLTKAQSGMGGEQDTGALLQRNLSAVRAALGGPPATARTPGTLSRKDQKYQEALRDQRIGGDQKKLDTMLKNNGVTVTD